MTRTMISVVTPVYNGANFIEDTILSVLENSKGFSIDFHVINDGSTDETASILEKYRHEVRITTTANCGESNAVNLGIQDALGEIVLVVSADDPLFTPKLFQGVAETFNKNPDLVALYPAWQVIDQESRVLEIKRPGPYSDSELIGKFHCLPGPGTFFRKSAAIQISGRSVRWKFVGDYDFWLRLSRIGNFEYRDQVLAQWRAHQNSTSIQMRGQEMASERILVIRNFLQNNDVSAELARQALGSCYVYAAQLCYFSKAVPGKRYLATAFIKARRWPPVAKLKVVLYITLTPFSRFGLELFRIFSK